MAASDSQLSVSMLAGLTANVELLMPALDVLVEAEQLVVNRCSCSAAGSSMCLYGHGPYFFKIDFRANGMSSSYCSLQQLLFVSGIQERVTVQTSLGSVSLPWDG